MSSCRWCSSSSECSFPFLADKEGEERQEDEDEEVFISLRRGLTVSKYILMLDIKDGVRFFTCSKCWMSLARWSWSVSSFSRLSISRVILVKMGVKFYNRHIQQSSAITCKIRYHGYRVYQPWHTWPSRPSSQWAPWWTSTRGLGGRDGWSCALRTGRTRGEWMKRLAEFLTWFRGKSSETMSMSDWPLGSVDIYRDLLFSSFLFDSYLFITCLVLPRLASFCRRSTWAIVLMCPKLQWAHCTPLALALKRSAFLF